MGFRKDAIVMLPVPERDKSKISALNSEISRITGVEKVTFCSQCTGIRGFCQVWTMRFDSRTEYEDFDISVKAGNDQYVSTFNLQVIAGRNLLPSDTVREFLLNETAVKKLGLNAGDVIGKRMVIGLNNSEGVIVGVVKDFHNKSFHETIHPLCITTANQWYSNCAIKINPVKLVVYPWRYRNGLEENLS